MSKKFVSRLFIDQEKYTVESNEKLPLHIVANGFVRLINEDEKCPYKASFDGSNLVLELPSISIEQTEE